jgi:hypothetical protein
MLALQLPHDQRDDDNHDNNGQHGSKELQPGLRAPVGERGFGPGGSDNQDREVA